MSAAPSGYVAIVLHAHLPYVRHPEHERSLEERWLHEALWETYLPLTDMLDRLAAEGVAAPISLSVSPTLSAMWADPLLCARSADHLRRTRALCEKLLSREAAGPFKAALGHHQALLARAESSLSRHRGNVLPALVRHHKHGRLHLFTTSATHAFLPGLAPHPAWIRAQIDIGRRAFEARTGLTTPSFWLPECAFAPPLDAVLARRGVSFTVLDAHGLALAEPSPFVATIRTANGAHIVPTVPVRSPAGVSYFGRDLWADRSVWAADGYPSNPAYREFHRDVGFDAAPEDLDGEIGPNGVRVATGIKLYRVTGPGADKAPYDPAAARARALADAAAFVDDRARLFSALPKGKAPPISVVPFDAELFGHFWHEGPVFLEEVLRLLARSAQAGGPAPISLASYAERYPASERAQPAASTWGEGGFSATWTGPRTAPLWRPIHRAAAVVAQAVRAIPDARGAAGEALDQAIVEALLLQASDFAFMIHSGTTAEYAATRIVEHSKNASRLAAIAFSGASGQGEKAVVREARARAPFLSDLPEGALRAPLLSES